MDIITRKALVVNARCPRCGGNLFKKHDGRGDYLLCELGCNREYETDLQPRKINTAKRERVKW